MPALLRGFSRILQQYQQHRLEECGSCKPGLPERVLGSFYGVAFTMTMGERHSLFLGRLQAIQDSNQRKQAG